MKINQHNNSIARNTSPYRQKIKYIVVHYTASNNSTAKNNCDYFCFNPQAVDSSADFFVDEKEIWQYNSQINSRYCWAVGDGSGGTYGGKCNNANSIHIEMCCYCKNNQWFIKSGTYNNTLNLVKYLMDKYKISVNNVIRHYDVSLKYCPQVSGWIPPLGESVWHKFKKELTNTENSINAEKEKTEDKLPFLVRVKITDLRIRKEPTLQGKFVMYCPPSVYTIVDIAYNDGYTWGKLKSGVGWIALEYTNSV